MEVPRGGEGFPKRFRLTKRSEFLTLSRRGNRTHAAHFVILSQPNDTGQCRLGITVTTRVGNAVIRNRIKRLVREFFRRERSRIPQARDIVVIARRGAEELSLSAVAGELRAALSQGKSRQR
jgi:ribonuclease P protein component